MAHIQIMTPQMQAWNPANIVWQEFNPDGTKYALLEGVKDKAGIAFTYAFFIPGGVWDAPHFHSTDSRIVVLTGQLKLGMGDSFDKEQAHIYEVGSYLYVPAEATHYDGAEVDTLIIGTATGLWSTTYI